MERKTFVFYKGWSEAIKDLPDDIRLEIYESIIEYATTGNLRGLKPMANVAFNFIKADLDRDTEKYISTTAKNKLNGDKGGRPRKEELNNPKNPLGFDETQPNPKNLDNDNDYDNDIKKDSKESKKGADKPTRFIPPTLSEVQKYISDSKYSVDASTFVDFYTAKGWMVGKNKMKDWQAAVRTWQRKEKQYRPEEIGVTLKNNSSDKYDNDKLW